MRLLPELVAVVGICAAYWTAHWRCVVVWSAVLFDDYRKVAVGLNGVNGVNGSNGFCGFNGFE